ncbi:unnamed protein product [Mytilus edulis]|uniref:Uncharacterized protein n=1 Tax=Mytilus edulis TaxID=6550 RepID=A0A8S3S5I2_MYTED|nr:unnamed protein product [Mytilus edulis]
MQEKIEKNGQGGGWIVYFDNNIKYERLTSLESENIETMWFRIFPKHKSYSNLPPAVLRFNEPDIPLVEGELSIDMSSFPAALKGKFKWLKHVAENSSVKAKVGKNISWSAYHAVVLSDANKLPAVSALLPLFHEQAKSVALIRHSLNIIRNAVRKLNPGQTPVVAFDQPLFTIAKQL